MRPNFISSELGCNIGANLKAIELLSPQIKLKCVEINKNAVSLARGEFPDQHYRAEYN